ncbi:hypothetical protein GWN65_02645, partial [Candidatus Bathyarchaeota archaeon]|nr:hypothetical protein [Candidatus Bathyarchaeota archaeon]NIV43930.1 hypothetical protein [Candidatus Bathyarchaeota archaeon]NIW10161.1 hypothetical protein [Gammaproteobacteria bacterium]
MVQTIREGDDVLLYLSRKRTFLVKVERNKSFHTHKGYVHLEDLIGKNYGARLRSSMDTEFVALKPAIRDYI